MNAPLTPEQIANADRYSRALARSAVFRCECCDEIRDNASAYCSSCEEVTESYVGDHDDEPSEAAMREQRAYEGFLRNVFQGGWA